MSGTPAGHGGNHPPPPPLTLAEVRLCLPPPDRGSGPALQPFELRLIGLAPDGPAVPVTAADRARWEASDDEVVERAVANAEGDEHGRWRTTITGGVDAGQALLVIHGGPGTAARALIPAGSARLVVGPDQACASGVARPPPRHRAVAALVDGDRTIVVACSTTDDLPVVAALERRLRALAAVGATDRVAEPGPQNRIQRLVRYAGPEGLTIFDIEGPLTL